MNLTAQPLPSPEAVLRGDLPDYSLLFHPLFGDIVALTPIALAVWRAVNGQRSVAEIAAFVQAQCEDVPPDVADDVAVFLDDLRRRGFVSLEPAHPLVTGEAESKGFLTRQWQAVCDVPVITETGDFPVKFFGPISLSLADGSCFHLAALDEPAGRLLGQFATAAGLDSPGEADGGQRLYLATADARSEPSVPRNLGNEKVFYVEQAGPRRPKLAGGRGAASQIVEAPVSENDWLWLQLVRISAFIGQQVQPRGGLLLHSALALAPSPSSQAPSSGVLLAGRSGVGKSTASRRLPAPWCSLSDDVTLVVRDAAGGYWAHPWPTWSRIYEQHRDDRWNTQAAVPLRAIFILEQGAQDSIRPTTPAEAVSLLMELSQQASRHLWREDYRKPQIDDLRTFNCQRLDNVCALVSAVPVYLLDVTLDGSFWREIEQVMALEASISPT